MKIQLITAVAALWSCRVKRPDPFDLSESTHPVISVVHNEKHGPEKLAENASNKVRKLLQSSMIDVLVE